MELQMSADRGVLYVTATGEFFLEEAKRTFVDLMNAAAQRAVGKVFFDGRGIEGHPETIHRFYYGEFAAGTVISYHSLGLCAIRPTFAYVLKEPVLDPERFGETVAVNRGMSVKAFDNVKEARTWLGLAPATAGQ